MSREPRRRLLPEPAALLRAAVLFAWAGLFVGFDLAGRLPHFLAPGFRPLVMVSGILLALLGVAVLLAGRGGSCCGPGDACGQRGGAVTKGQAATAVLLLALLAGTAFSAPRGFSASTVLNRMGGADFSRGIAPPVKSRPAERGAGTAGRTAVFAEPPVQESAETEPAEGGQFDPPADPQPYLTRDEGGKIEADLMDLWAAAADPGFRRHLADQTIIVTGQLLKPPAGSPEPAPGAPRFKLVRLMVTCCAADARPVSIPVFADAMPGEADMSWIRVEGRLVLKVEGGEYVPYLKAESVQPGEEPAEVFLFN